ncbi:L-asparaginase domain-containing protein [Paramicrosporidium saccamoebae]|uniref:asparaginase n=1 Tax=Paramicrosporidium saccamoebae TaxID=1246581 RepID=A0A2H9TQK2_9FUNG|nr:L-asparaginase domain-containing protein [Paramicrosporidium saccamoebae]
MNWHTNTVVEYAKASAPVQNMTGNAVSKVLVLYCGGTIGMRNDPVHGYFPVAGYLSNYLANDSSFNDSKFVNSLSHLAENDPQFDITSMDNNIGQMLALKPSMYGKRIVYQVLEYDPLKDSCNMVMDDWIKIAKDIEAHYQAYDAFVILHGTDTMAYTASALSFLLQHLGKTVIFTGSQIPFSEVRNDARDNLLGALTIAGHFMIPEVCLFFGHRLYRGNRVSKSNAVGFEAFSSPNLKPLGIVGVDIDIEWAEVLRPTDLSPFKVKGQMDPNVGCLRIFPGITANSLRAFLAAPTRGVILETFGTGNAPDNRPELIQVIREAVDRGVVIVNITQCQRGTVSEIYSTGHALAEAGVISGRDMTVECALVKLSYLLGQPELDLETVRRLVSESLRGELTIPLMHKDKFLSSSVDWLGIVFNSALISAAPGHRGAVDELLRPLIIHVAASKDNVAALESLAYHENIVNCVDYDLRTPLHVAVSCESYQAVKWLLQHGANVHLRDSLGKTPV